MSQRTQRVDELLRQEIGALLAKEIADPRIGFATITDVETSPDLGHAKVWVSVIGGQADRVETIRALQQAMGYVRRQLGQRLRIRRIPELHVQLDDSAERGTRVLHLINELEAGADPDSITPFNESLRPLFPACRTRETPSIRRPCRRRPGRCGVRPGRVLPAAAGPVTGDRRASRAASPARAADERHGRPRRPGPRRGARNRAGAAPHGSQRPRCRSREPRCGHPGRDAGGVRAGGDARRPGDPGLLGRPATPLRLRARHGPRPDGPGSRPAV